VDREEENTYLNFSKTMKNLFYKLGGKEEMKAKKLLDSINWNSQYIKYVV